MDLFDSILLAEERFRNEGFQEGFKRGTRRGLQDGRRHGASHGARLSSEISFYYGFTVTWKCLLQHNSDVKSRKRLKAMETLQDLIQTALLDDPLSTKQHDDTEKLRAKFRQVCAMLSVPTDFNQHVKTAEGTSF
ncbi:protein LTO1 homolog [Mugil cephalus]|uniref:protein LTO1 homolog n=1 Tax=Mugil cephalus TaxID=48193 RepID=UPI001FB64F1E|nr:protein LTO1 homolog [Mugil cephalus]